MILKRKDIVGPTAGIDYARGAANVDESNGIRYGVACNNDLSSEAMEDVYQKGEDLDFKEYKRQVISEIQTALVDAVEKVSSQHHFDVDNLEPMLQDFAEALGEDISFDHYEGSGDTPRVSFEKDDLNILTTSSNTLFVIKSKYVTRCKFCSPCYPGAGDLGSYDSTGVLCYHPGPDFYDEYQPFDGKIWELKGSGDTKELVLVYDPEKVEQ